MSNSSSQIAIGKVSIIRKNARNDETGNQLLKEHYVLILFLLIED